MKNQTNYDEQPVNIRVKLAGLWTSMLFVFAYVDIFGLFRKDVLEDALAGKVHVFDANQQFFIFALVYILFACIILALTLILSARKARLMNIVAAAVYIITIVGGAVGESWIYYLIGSAVEVVLLAVIIRLSLKWPKN